MSRFTGSTFRAFLALALALGMAWGSETGARVGARDKQTARDQANYQAWLTREVRHQLVLLPYLTLFDNLEYKVDGTTVTLMGQVVDPSLKPDAANVVKHIEGVTKVINNIEVLPPSPMDAQIRRAEYRAIYGFADLWKYAMGALPPVHIVVDMGHVNLYGVVDNQSDKNLIELRAKTVPGVFTVTDNLEVANQGGK